jgi:hypothetical protein
VAPTTTAPVESVMVPFRVAALICACKRAEPSESIPAIATAQAIARTTNPRLLGTALNTFSPRFPFAIWYFVKRACILASQSVFAAFVVFTIPLSQGNALISVIGYAIT